MQDFAAELELTAAAIEKRALDAYRMTLQQLEVAIITAHGPMVTLLRKARGQPELRSRKPDESQ